MLTVGIVGGSGSGKTTVLNIYAEKGAKTLLGDELSREVCAPGHYCTRMIKRQFGPDFFDEDGNLLRKKLGKHVFGNEALRKQLNAIVHPAMLQQLKNKLDLWCAEGVKIVVFEAAVMDEMGARPLMDKTILVYSSDHDRLVRLQERDGLNLEEAQNRLALQRLNGMIETKSDYEIPNLGDLRALRSEADRVWWEMIADESEGTA